MDPTATLLRIRGLLKAADSFNDSTSPESLRSVLEALREAVRDLDEWLSKGGFPPDQWQQRLLGSTARDLERATSEALAVANSHDDLSVEIDETFG